MTEFENHRCGYVAIMGRPNAGKSTLLNKILGEKVSIVSHKPQTTRNRVVGIHNAAGLQAILVDTPGIHEARSRLNKALVSCATSALNEVDATCWVVDLPRAVARDRAGRGQGSGFDREAIRALLLRRFLREGGLAVVLGPIDVELEGERAWASFNAALADGVSGEAFLWEGEALHFEVELVREEGDWLVASHSREAVFE